MKLLYIDSFAGISGDMMVGALLDAGISLDQLKNELAKVPLEGYDLSCQKVLKGGLTGTKFTVEALENQPHRHLADILKIIEQSSLHASLKEKAKTMFHKLALVEGKIHNQSPDKIHFHEVGAVDSIIDILATLICLDLLTIQRVVCSPLPITRGWVQCQHGLIPIPSPATMELLKGIPVKESSLEGELVTPTGALLAASLAHDFGSPPSFTVETIGYGAGTKDLPVPNLLRILIGCQEPPALPAQETVTILETNIDDANPEFYPYILAILLEQGALDAYLTPVIMKKGRPGIVLTVLAPADRLKPIQELIFAETSTLGIRFRQETRLVLPRKFITVQTLYGPIRVKYSHHPASGQILTVAPEYEDCRFLAAESKTPLKVIYEEAKSLAQKLLLDNS